jgi:iron complex outermembrane receptor protein
MTMSASTIDRVCVLCLASLGAAGPGASVAAESAAPNSAGALEEIVVTAQRREENVQNIAVAVTALSGEMLADKAVARLDDLQFASPALTITDAGLTQSVNIRGVGLASGSPQVTPGVATYVDGVFQPAIVSTPGFYDIGTIEVLRGPQGTFVGSSSTGGAIFINSRNPDLNRTDGYVEAAMGNYSNRTAQGAINVPITDTLAVRFAGNYRHRDSYYTDIGPLGNEPAGLDEASGRLGVLWKPTDAFQALLKSELIERETGGYAYRPSPDTPYAALRSSDPRLLAYDDPTRNDEHASQTTLELRYELPNGVTLRSLSGYQDKDIRNLYDFDASIQPSPPPNPFPRVTQDQYVRERVLTQEINVISRTDGAFDWIVGGYFQRNKIDVDIEQPSDGFMTDINIANRKTGTGYFGQIGYKFTPALKLNVGGRYSTFDASSRGAVIIGRGVPVPPFNTVGLPVADLSGTHEDGRGTGKVALEWTPNDDNLMYAFVARGYKPGGFNSATDEFDPETVTDYELGWKSTLFDGRLRTQVGGFWYDYTGFQLDLLSPLTGQVQTENIADATLRGVEVQAQARFGGWGFDFGIAYVDSELSDVQFVNQRALPPGTNLPQCAPGASPGVPPTCFDYTPFMTSATGRSMLYSPEVTYNAGTEYTFLIGNATLRPRINYGYIGAQFTNLLYSPTRDRLAPRGLLSAQLTYARDAWSLEAYGTNLADKEYVAGQFGNNETYGAPREYGLRASIRF